MSGKTISNGTLSLRFMQNAQRAKQQAQVEADQAKIRDDAEWSISQDVRDAWGIGSPTSSNAEVQHEASYLPFILQSDVGEGSSSGSHLDSRPRLRGRRTFNARGKEVISGETTVKMEESKAGQWQELDQQADEKPSAGLPYTDDKARSRFERRPTSISGFKGPLSTRRDEKKPRTKTVQMLIREDVSVRPPISLQQQRRDSVSILTPTDFVKPAGVDEPVPSTRKMSPDGRKRARGQDLRSERLGLEGSQRKKRRETETSS